MKNGHRLLSVFLLFLPAGVTVAGQAAIEAVAGQAELGFVEFHGLAAGPFDQSLWEAGRLHWVPDQRHPLIRPQMSGVFRNIYAPSAVEMPDGWQVFYGAWDGVDTGNDRIYRVLTKDFLDFADRRTIIEHGDFVHVCNVNAIRLADGTIRMVCTAYPDEKGLNRPAMFSMPAGEVSSGSIAPHPASCKDFIEIEGYRGFDTADMNGMNVILHEDGIYRLYFGDFKAMGQVYRASSKDGRHFRYDGACMDFHGMVNDVKKITREQRHCYLMAAHRNADRLWYALSSDGARFDPPKELVVSLGEEDRYIVAVGWVMRGDRVLGMLYGAGAVPSLDRNRIFARWLQKRILFTDAAGHRYEPIRALGPDRQILSLEGHTEIEGRIQVFGEDGMTPVMDPVAIKLVSGGIYRMTIPIESGAR